MDAVPNDPNNPTPTEPEPETSIPPPARLPLVDEIRIKTQRFMKQHGHKLWWLHSCYALGLGVSVATFAQKGFAHARWLAFSLGLAWLLVILFFRLFGTGARAQNYATAERTGRIRFLVMTYVLKNLYQGMLFFLLPFYWNSATMDSPNRYYVFLLAICAVLSTLDVVFDRFLMRSRYVASMFYGVTLFSCMNLVIPAFLPNTRTLYTLLAAAAITVIAFWTLHVPISQFKNRIYLIALAGSILVGMGVAYGARQAIPPVPMHVSYGAVGPMLLPDGRLAMEVRTLHVSVIRQLQAVTDVVVPGGRGDRLYHVWRHEGHEVYRRRDPGMHSIIRRGAIRLHSGLTGPQLPAQLAGHWSVDVETEDQQLVGRVSFNVIE